MINYGDDAKKTVFVDQKNNIYRRIECQGENPCFVKIQSLDEFNKACKNYPFDRETLDLLSMPPYRLSGDDFASILAIILDANKKLLILKESADYITKNSENPMLGAMVTARADMLEDVVDKITHFWADLGKKMPNYAYNFRPSLFEIPGVRMRIENGEEKFNDGYGTVETSNHRAYQDLIIRDMMFGVENLSPAQLTRVENMGINKDQRLEQEFQDQKELS